MLNRAEHSLCCTPFPKIDIHTSSACYVMYSIQTYKLSFLRQFSGFMGENRRQNILTPRPEKHCRVHYAYLCRITQGNKQCAT